MKKLFKLAAVVVLFGVAAIVGFGQLATRATLSEVPPLAKNEQLVSLTTADGVRIAASFFSVADEKAPTVLLLHGNGATRVQFQGHVAWLNDAGFAAMAIDFRGHGESEAGRKSFGLFESRDAEAAVKWIRANRPGTKVGVIGVSLGGAAALLGASGPLNVDAMVVQAVYPDIHRAIYNRIASRIGGILAAFGTPMLTWQSLVLYGESPVRISPVKAAHKFGGPVFVIGGEHDVYTPVDETKELHDSFRGKRTLWIAPGLGHDQLSGASDGQYETRVLAFLEANLR